MSGYTPEKQACANQIKGTRKRLGLSQQAFAAQLGTSQSNVAKWEAGSHRPSPEQFMALSRIAHGTVEEIAFMSRAGVSNAWFEGRVPRGHIPTVVAEDAIRQASNQRLGELAASGLVTELEGATRLVPLLKDAVAAGAPRAIDEKDIQRLIPVPSELLPHGGQLYAVPVNGDSMAPILLDGHIVFLDLSRKKPDDLIQKMVCARDDNGFVTIKWLRHRKGIYSLVPQHTAPEYEVEYLKPLGEFTVVGEVVMWIGTPPKPPKNTRRKL